MIGGHYNTECLIVHSLCIEHPGSFNLFDARRNLIASFIWKDMNRECLLIMNIKYLVQHQQLVFCHLCTYQYYAPWPWRFDYLNCSNIWSRPHNWISSKLIGDYCNWVSFRSNQISDYRKSLFQWFVCDFLYKFSSAGNNVHLPS